MLHEPKTIIVDPESELGHLLDEATDAPLILEKNGVRYRLTPENAGSQSENDNETYQKVLDETIGSWSDIDADAMIAAIYRAREEGTRPIDRPDTIFRTSGLYGALPAHNDEKDAER